MTSKDIIETGIPTTLTEKPELAKDINAVIHFDISGDNGGKWTLDCTKPDGWVSQGINGASKMTVYMSNDDFVKIHEKKLNSQMAAMQGKIKFKPMDMGLAMKLAKLLG
jgi:putative sterol carrier protein